MRKVLAGMLALVAATFGMSPGLAAAASARRAATGAVHGVAKDAAQQNLPGVRVQVRAPNGQLASTAVTSAQGRFSFTGLTPGNYIIEILDADGNVIGTSASVTVTADETTTVTITAAAAGAIAAGSGGGLSRLGLGILGTVAVISGAATLTTVAIVATKKDASPSR